MTNVVPPSDDEARPLSAGDRLGPYEIVGLLGIGGMGAVYRARDPRIRRDVAVKVMRRMDAAHTEHKWLAQEARAAGALNHPNILAVFDVGLEAGRWYVVSELLEGETLRQKLRGESLSPRKATSYAIQIAAGLSAAHDKGISHRDIKPENLFLTPDDRLKILDFGLAKIDAGRGQVDTAASTSSMSRPGAARGTAGYMAPEQVLGEPVDHRADIFSLGAVLYEMLTGARAFRGASPVESVAAVLTDQVDERLERHAAPIPGLAQAVRRCLEKNKQSRFQSARDLAFHLERLLAEPPSSMDAAASRRGHPRSLIAAAAVLGATAAALALLGWQRIHRPVGASFQRLTFAHGRIASARFAPDGQSIVYSEARAGGLLEVWFKLPGAPESRALGYAGDVLGVSRAGELLLSLHQTYVGGERFSGTLARAPVAGDVAPRPIVERVEGGAWDVDGGRLAVVHGRGVGTPTRVEYPIGRTIYQTSGSIRCPRVSPDGSSVAFLEDAAGLGVEGMVKVVDGAANVRTLTKVWRDAEGLTWSPAGDRIWFTAGDGESHRVLREVSLRGDQRIVAEIPGTLTVRDTAPDGRVLVSQDDERISTLCGRSDQAGEVNVSWFDLSALADLSRDGRTVLFADRGGIYVRKTDGSPAIRLGLPEGYADALSPRADWAVCTTRSTEQLVLLPIGAGEPRLLPRGAIASYAGAAWFPDGERILFNAREPERGLRSYVLELAGGTFEAVTPENTWALSISPDGSTLAAITRDEGISLWRVDGGPRVTVPGSKPGDRPVGWNADARWLWVFRRNEIPAKVERLEIATGRRQLWKTLTPPEPGAYSLLNFSVTPAGDAYCYSYRRRLSDLYLVNGLH